MLDFESVSELYLFFAEGNNPKNYESLWIQIWIEQYCIQNQGFQCELEGGLMIMSLFAGVMLIF